VKKQWNVPLAAVAYLSYVDNALAGIAKYYTPRDHTTVKAAYLQLIEFYCC